MYEGYCTTKIWRTQLESNQPMPMLQTGALPLCYVFIIPFTATDKGDLHSLTSSTIIYLWSVGYEVMCGTYAVKRVVESTNKNNEPTLLLLRGNFPIAHRHRFNGMFITVKPKQQQNR